MPSVAYADQPEEALPSVFAPLGRALRAARLERGAAIGDAAQDLRIAPRFLAAMESGDFDALPSGGQGWAFVRAYAGWLGLDADAALAWARKLDGTPAPAQALAQDAAAQEAATTGRGLAGLGVVLAMIAASALAFGLWRVDAPPSASVPSARLAPSAAFQARALAPAIVPARRVVSGAVHRALPRPPARDKAQRGKQG